MDRHQLRVAASARIKEHDQTRAPEQTDTSTTPTLIIYRPHSELKPIPRSTQRNPASSQAKNSRALRPEYRRCLLRIRPLSGTASQTALAALGDGRSKDPTRGRPSAFQSPGVVSLQDPSSGGAS